MMNTYRKNPSSLFLVVALILAIISPAQVRASGDLAVDDDFAFPSSDDEIDALFGNNSTLLNATDYFSTDNMTKTGTNVAGDSESGKDATSGPADVETSASVAAWGHEIALAFSALVLFM